MTTGVDYSDSSGIVTTVPSDAEPASSPGDDFRSAYPTVHDIRPHCAAGGGKPLILPPVVGSAPSPWWFAAHHAPGLPEELSAGRTPHVVDWMVDNTLVNPDAAGDRDRVVFAQRSDSPEGIRTVKVVVVDAGHHFVDEAPQAVIDEFTNFFD
ncbi:hypothetical protein ACQPYE_23630 [Actinosynnema sp. CA-299493]